LFAAHNTQVPKLVEIAAKLIARDVREVNFTLCSPFSRGHADLQRNLDA
jgi:hypothetical protein